MRHLDHAAFIHRVALPWKSEYDEFGKRPSGDLRFTFDNTLFGSVDAEMLYAMVRHHRPERVLEVGAGWSTLLIREALERNGKGSVASFDPSPPSFLSGVTREKISVNAAAELERDDILFIDGSHIRQPGSDVDVIFSDILLTLRQGVWVHFHDIFLPDPYPESWVGRGYNEQDHLAAFLEADPKWGVWFSSHHAQQACPEVLAEAFASYDETKWPGSFWMRRKA